MKSKLARVPIHNYYSANDDDELYNLFISGSPDLWEENTATLDRNRCIVEFSSEGLSDKYGKLSPDIIDELKSYPCIFAYEDSCEKDAYIGFISRIIVRPNGVKIIFEKEQLLPRDILHKQKFELDIGEWELNRTHWAIKKVNLYNELAALGIDLKNSVVAKPINIENHFFDVAVTFAGETREFVESIVLELEKLIPHNNIFYDNFYTSQLARPSLDILLQDIYRNRAKLVVVFLGEKYQEKKWCGLEFKSIREMIMEKEEKKIMYVRLDNGHVGGVFKIDGYIDGNKFTPNEIAKFIQERLSIME